MPRLIDADALEEGKFHSTEDWTPIESASWRWGWNDAIDAIINNAPRVDPFKHGHWVIERDGTVMHCNSCGWAYEYYGGLEEEWNYCPHCGAKMDEVTG